MKNKNIYLILCIVIGLMLSACANNLNSELDSETDTSETTDTSESDVDTEDISTPEVGIDLEGTYDQNDLLITTLEKEYEDIVLEIPQIEGLKDSSVQEKVNQDIYARVEQAYKDIPQLNYVMYNTLANFSNVLSIGVYIGGEDNYKQIYLNYNLVNGNRLTFEELFLSDTDTLGLIRNAFRDMLIKDQMQGSYDENELYKMVKRYSESEDKIFAFTPSNIMLCYKDYIASVKMLDIAEEVGIYSKYVTEDSLYTRNDIGKKDIFTCVEVLDAFDIWEYGLLEDNLWCDFVIPKAYFEDDTDKVHLEGYGNFKGEIYDEICEQIENYREIAKNNPERFYIVLVKANIYMEMDSELVDDRWVTNYTGNVIANKNIQTFEMPLETYDKIYKDKILEAYRYEYYGLAGGIYLEATEDDVIWGGTTEEIHYNYITGEKDIYE